MFDDLITPPILEFTGENHFLSNFFPASFAWRGKLWATSEHAYQAAKSLDPEVQERIRLLPSPGATKRAGKVIALRPDWEQVKVDIMLEIVFEKFRQNPQLIALLLATGDAELIEGNWWHDRFWGVCPVGSSKGRNELGKILMDIRAAFSGHF
jgi:N-glycosidase YbiA